MNTLDIHLTLKNNEYTKKIYHGTYAANHLPRIQIKKPTLMIMNLSNSNTPGSHWVALYLTPKIFELFDSGGRKLENHHELTRFRQYHKNKKFLHNKIQVQSNFTSTCGHFCCIFALIKAKNISTKRFLNIFRNKKLIENDKKVFNLFNKHFIIMNR